MLSGVFQVTANVQKKSHASPSHRNPQSRRRKVNSVREDHSGYVARCGRGAELTLCGPAAQSYHPLPEAPALDSHCRQCRSPVLHTEMTTSRFFAVSLVLNCSPWVPPSQ